MITSKGTKKDLRLSDSAGVRFVCLLFLCLIAGCGGGGSNANPDDQLAGQWVGTWSNAAKGLTGRASAEYVVIYEQSGGQTIRRWSWEGIFYDSADIPLFRFFMVGDVGRVSPYPQGGSIAEGPGFQRAFGVFNAATFTATGHTAEYSGSTFVAQMTKQ